MEREKKVLNLLDDWPWEYGGVIIGGYAISSYGKPRYSNDIDIVVSYSSSEKVRNWLIDFKFNNEISAQPNPQNYTGQVYRGTG